MQEIRFPASSTWFPSAGYSKLRMCLAVSPATVSAAARRLRLPPHGGLAEHPVSVPPAAGLSRRCVSSPSANPSESSQPLLDVLNHVHRRRTTNCTRSARASGSWFQMFAVAPPSANIASEATLGGHPRTVWTGLASTSPQLSSRALDDRVCPVEIGDGHAHGAAAPAQDHHG